MENPRHASRLPPGHLVSINARRTMETECLALHNSLVSDPATGAGKENERVKIANRNIYVRFDCTRAITGSWMTQKGS